MIIMASKTINSTRRKNRAVSPLDFDPAFEIVLVSPAGVPRVIHDFGRDFFFDGAAQKITAVTDPTLVYDFCEASSIRHALDCGEIDTLEMLWKDKEIPFKSLLSDNPSRNTHNDEFNFRMYGYTNCRKCGSALYREDKTCSTCGSPTHLKKSC